MMNSKPLYKDILKFVKANENFHMTLVKSLTINF